MKVFLGWSGNLSRQLADTFHTWLKCVIQSVDPFFSSHDIDKGATWHSSLTGTLKTCSYGIFFITEENMGNSWMHFEAGALSKEIGDARVCPFLFRLHDAMLEGPFAHFQAVRFDEDDIFRLLTGLNESMDSPLPDEVLRESFATYWPRLQKKLMEIDSAAQSRVAHGMDSADGNDIADLKRMVESLFQRDNLHAVGLRHVYTDRLHSLSDMRHEIDSEGKEIIIIGSSLKGLIGIGGDPAGDQNLVRIAFMDALKRGVKVRILMTHPEVAHHRSKQEGRESGEIEREIIENLIYFTRERRDNKEAAKNLEVKLYNGTPTIFTLCTSHTMFFNPYTFYSKAYDTLCFRVVGPSPVRDNYYNNHYLQAWNDRRLSKILDKRRKMAMKELESLVNGTNQHDEPLIPDDETRQELFTKIASLEDGEQPPARDK